MLDGSSAATLESLTDAIVKFTPVTDFTTFTAEYALKDQDLVIHFFLPEDLRGPPEYWSKYFPLALDRTARAYFEAEAPKLQAKYTPELRSWWFRARGYDHLIDLSGFVEGFLSQLDSALDPLVSGRGG